MMHVYYSNARDSNCISCIDLDDYCSLLRTPNPQQCSITTCMHMNYGLYDYYLFGFYMKNKKLAVLMHQKRKFAITF